MVSNMGDGAKKLGKALCEEIEVEGLSSSLRSLQTCLGSICKNEQDPNEVRNAVFGIQELDELLLNQCAPIVELVSQPTSHHTTGAGKTSLLYYIIAHAILPYATSPDFSIRGQNGAVVLFDPLHRFDVSRLAHEMISLLCSGMVKPSTNVDTVTKSEIRSLVTSSLTHLHLFRPQSWESCLTTLRSLPDYLINGSTHQSMHRHVHSVILEDLDSYIWSIRDESKSTTTNANPLTGASSLLTSALDRLSKSLSCSVILTSRSISSTLYRPPIPTSWPQTMPITRLAVERTEVLNFAPAISVEEARVQKQQRWNVVQQGRFYCGKAEKGLKRRDGFVYQVFDHVVGVEKV